MVVVSALQRLFQERLHLLVKVLTDGYYMGLGKLLCQTGASTKVSICRVETTLTKSLDDYGIEGLVGWHGDGARGQNAAGSQFGDLVNDVHHQSAHGSGAMAVAVAKHILNKFVQVATEEGGELYLDQLPQVACGQLENQRSFQRSVKSGTAPELSPP